MSLPPYLTNEARGPIKRMSLPPNLTNEARGLIKWVSLPPYLTNEARGLIKRVSSHTYIVTLLVLCLRLLPQVSSHLNDTCYSHVIPMKCTYFLGFQSYVFSKF